MHAFLLVGGEKESLGNEISKISKYEKRFSFRVTKIEEVRKLKRLANILKEHTLVINSLSNASIEAQNAFLKTLEEPPSNIQFILTAPNLNNLLDTIVSRCTVVNIKTEKVVVDDPDVTRFFEGKLSEKLNVVQAYQNKGAIDFVEKIAEYLHINLVDHTRRTEKAKLLKKTLAIHKLLKANVNSSLTLSALAIGFHKVQKRT